MEKNSLQMKKKWRFAKAKARIPERDYGITGEIEPPAYDEMLRFERDGGWLPLQRILRSISNGLALEIGPGPGYLGLEFLKQTQGTRLIGYDISDDMLAIARKNSEEYHLTGRATYQKGDVHKIPFEDNRFDAVFSNDSFHEWSHPERALNEIYRVLKPGAKYHISDLRRDMMFFLKFGIWVVCRPAILRSGWLTSIDASYTRSELQTMLSKTNMKGAFVEQDALRFYISGKK